MILNALKIDPAATWRKPWRYVVSPPRGFFPQWQRPGQLIFLSLWVQMVYAEFAHSHTHIHTRSPDANVDMLDCCRPLEWVKRYGITLAEFAWVIMCIIALEGKKLNWAAYLAV